VNDYQSDGEPGITVIWRGWQRLQDIADTWNIAKDQTLLMGNCDTSRHRSGFSNKSINRSFRTLTTEPSTDRSENGV
jgi:hypothetical protein